MNIRTALLKHKVLTPVIALVIVASGFGVYTSINRKPDAPRYITGHAEKGTLVVSVSGSGQVSAKNSIDIKSKVSGDVLSVSAQEGARVKKGAVLARIDARDAEKNVRDAENNLQSAHISLQKLQKPADALALLQAKNALAQSTRDFDALVKPPDELALLQAENALAQSITTEKNAEDALQKARGDGFTAVANAFIDLPGIMSDVDDMLFKNTIANAQWNIDWYADQAKRWDDTVLDEKNDVHTAFERARIAYEKNLSAYTTARRDSDPATLEALIAETYADVKTLAETIKTTRQYVASIKDTMTVHDVKIPSAVTTHQASLDSYTVTANKHLTNLFSADSAIDNATESIDAGKRALREKTESLDKLKKGADSDDIENAREKIREREESLAKIQKGADDLDLASQKLVVTQRESALADAREKLGDYTIRAPFDGTLSAFEAKVGDSVSPATALGSLITQEKLVEISLNEVDIARVAVGQKATLTFDAIPNVSAVGTVAQVDTVGVSAQGVVTFTVTVAFDASDERIKPGMSATAVIITNTKTDVLLLPNAAIKTEGDASYVQTTETETRQARRRNIQIGLSNDESTEILGGITEQDTVVLRTVQSVQSTAQSQQRSIFQAPGGQGRGGGAGFRTGR